MAAIAVFLLSRHLAMNSVEGRAGNSDKGTGKNSDALLSEGDSADIHVDEACALQCL